MKKSLLMILGVVFLTTPKLFAQEAGKGPTCIDSSVAEKLIGNIKLAAESVERTSASMVMEIDDQPAAVVGLAAVAVTAAVVNAIAKEFEGNQMGNPQPVRIPWNDLTETPMQWYGSDGDIIEMSRKKGTGNLYFSQENDSYWWKGLVAFDHSDTNKWYELMCLYDQTQKHMTMQITPSLADSHYITLSKAKAFGVHTNMYLITNWEDASTSYDYVFKWVKD